MVPELRLGFYDFKELLTTNQKKKKEKKEVHVPESVCGLRHLKYLLFGPLQNKSATSLAKLYFADNLEVLVVYKNKGFHFTEFICQ